MYPKHYLDLFPAFPRGNRVFVAMPFGPPFDARWESVIAPAVRRVSHNGINLEPHRVDIRTAGDSIITEILEGISTAQIVVADISSIGKIDEEPVRNANVLYEVGLAQASRLPTEILLFRSDSDPLLFDISNIRVNHYDPDNDPKGAQRILGEAIVDAFRENDLTKLQAVAKAAAAMDVVAFSVLGRAATPNGLLHPDLSTMGQVLSNVQTYTAIVRLLDMGAIEATYPKITVAGLKESLDKKIEVIYRSTPFGNAIMERIAVKMGGNDPELMQYAEHFLDNGNEGD